MAGPAHARGLPVVGENSGDETSLAGALNVDLFGFREDRGELAFARELQETRVFAFGRHHVLAERRLRDIRAAQAAPVLPLGEIDSVIDSVARLQSEKRALGVEGPLLVCAGALIPRKGQSVAIKALVLVPGATLALVGDGPDRAALERLARRLDRAHRQLREFVLGARLPPQEGSEKRAQESERNAHDAGVLERKDRVRLLRILFNLSF